MAIALDAGARASFVEVFEGADAGVQRRPATVMTLGKGAKATHVALVGDEAALHIESQICELAETAELNAFGLVSGGDLDAPAAFPQGRSGDDAKVSLGGLGACSMVRGAPIRRCRSLHSAPGGTSREFYRAIVDDDAVGVFQGKIVVETSGAKDRRRDEIAGHPPIAPRADE